MEQHTYAVAAEVMEEQSSEPPSSMRAVQSPSSCPTETETPLCKKLSQWNDWRWQIRNRIRTLDQLAQYVPLLSGRGELQKVIDKYPMAITPYYASIIRRADMSDPVFRMSVPNIQELFDSPCLTDDPLEEHEDMPVPGLVHRYRDRALLIATTMCSMYCRHCTRKRIAGTRETAISARRMRQVQEYLFNHPEITDVIVSGGDPLTMSDAAIETVLSTLRSVPSVQVIRIGTRVPVVLPMRITDQLVAMLKKYHPLWINTHFNHPQELTAEARAACAKLADAGIPLGNQTVLLRGVNDDPQVIEQLCRGLISTRVRPYYIYQCDLVRGVEHFRTSVRKGIEIMEYLRGRVSGIAIPTFVVDAPHGGGKIPVLPTYVVSMSPTHTVLRNYEGLLVTYPEPGVDTVPAAGAAKAEPGVWELASGRGDVILPAHTQRMDRREKIHAKRAGAVQTTGYLFDA
ncbi:MAG TPA: KamA family radical SAM protein [Anaerohalosphaeraceae bacterium]|mgnify:CR=1 FL=1|nr:KamA family radical SAM protein [Anaerohalosphaeraceae bacterium]HOL31542.1 KamA family radical SAM protein [Anaerohalosphaeraceae bacterium]HOM75650.1 KamA family radical SAM protein [Anaerohalosphaeraceae bacterium]HPC64434.1 KamA family radical SAM protein [Anaerohalosphaeraceae bacterium]HPO68781.1 KamA family radical SAM protein [Anaerohalosphaeraceae bacterium]